MPLLAKIKRGLSKPPDVIWYRFRQELSLSIMGNTGAWKRLQSRVRSWWTPDNVAEAEREGPMLIVSKGSIPAVGALGMTDELVRKGEEVLARNISIFGAKMPANPDWQEDWKYGKRWSPAYFRTYNFYESEKEEPYDVRRMWELSRLSSLPLSFQAGALSGDVKFAKDAFALLRDWEKSNPLAYTVNWDPMEASIRAVNLVIMLEICQEAALGDADDHALLWRMLADHGEFVWRNVEYTDIRGNHYAANLLALLLLGLKLGRNYAPAAKWAAYAEGRIAEEIKLQFSWDGVNIEKSIPYHRLVTETFLLANVALSRVRRPLDAVSDKVLRSACLFTAAYTRPDGHAPNWGDNDNAKLSLMDPLPPYDHRGLLSLGALFYRDGHLKSAATALFPFAVWVMGPTSQTLWDSLEDQRVKQLVRFEEGGFEIAHFGDTYLLVDVGEVGLKGRGGHGHLDLFSFEFCCGIPVIVDPGSYVYTGDPSARRMFRSGPYHNVLLIDDQDLGTPSGMWDIPNAATPENVAAKSDDHRTVIEGSHQGFTEGSNPMAIRRTFTLESQSVMCEDTMSCREPHSATRYLHFDKGFEVSIEGASAIAEKSGNKFLVEWDSISDASLEPGWVSYGYGERVEAQILTLKSSTSGPTDVWFRIGALR